MIGLVRVGDAAASPVTTDEMKAHLRVTGTDEDDLIDAYLAAATAQIGAMTGLAMGLETWRFSTARPVGAGAIFLPKTPARAISTITYLDGDEVSQSATVSDFLLIADGARPYIRPGTGKAWPATASREDALTITFTAGLATVSAPLMQAIRLLVAHWFQNREAVAAGSMSDVPLTVAALIEAERTGWVAA